MSQGHSFTMDNIRQFVKDHPNNAMSAAWTDMLFDDPDGTEYALDDYQEEAEALYSSQDLLPISASSLCFYFPGTFSFDDGWDTDSQMGETVEENDDPTYRPELPPVEDLSTVLNSINPTLQQIELRRNYEKCCTIKDADWHDYCYYCSKENWDLYAAAAQAEVEALQACLANGFDPRIVEVNNG